MIRTIGVTALLVALASAAHAGDAPAGAFVVPYKPDQLGTTAGRESLKDEAAKRIDAFCRANPIEGTIADCRNFLTARADKAIEVKAIEYASRQQGIRVTQSTRPTTSGR